MGFFSELKEDLSQAANELLPGSEPEKNDKKADEGSSKEMDLSKMLENIESNDKPAQVKEEAPVASEPAKKSKISDENGIITAGMCIKGDITSGGSLEVMGEITGNITISGKLSVTGTVIGDSKANEVYAEGAKITGEINSMGSVKIGQSSVCIGNIFATSAVIAGAVKGNIDVHGPVILDTSAIVMGDIRSKSVQINNGAVIEGNCSQCYADVSPSSFFDGLKKDKK
jgi:cytoskeletal protein CcmA (bactofilin family)